jgi:hypothetical protein
VKLKLLDCLSRLAESPNPCNGWRGAFTACSALGPTGSSLGSSPVSNHYCNALPTMAADGITAFKFA